MECVSPVRCEVADQADLVLFTYHGEHADQASDFTSSCSNKQVGEEIDDFGLSIVVLRKFPISALVCKSAGQVRVLDDRTLSRCKRSSLGCDVQRVIRSGSQVH
jgi:hypothetical protein